MTVYSHTKLQSAMKCGQLYRWQYEDKVKERPNSGSRPMILGSAVHAAFEEALRAKTERPTLTIDGMIVLAVMHAREYIKGETRENVRKYVNGTLVYDSDYYEMMRSLGDDAQELITHYLPRVPASWRIATKRQVLDHYPADDKRGDELALEWTIYHTFWEDAETFHEFKGVVDAVIIDIDTGALMLVDWKVKGKFPTDDKASLDGQLHLYAAILNAAGAKIREVCMFQMLSTPPAVAETGQGAKNKGQILTGRDGYATTWEYWCATVPFGTDVTKYEVTMRPKMKEWDYFIRPVVSPVTRHTSNFVLQNAMQAIRMIENDTLPARLDAYACGFCPMSRLCDALKNGGNVETLIQMAYDRETEEEETDG